MPKSCCSWFPSRKSLHPWSLIADVRGEWVLSATQLDLLTDESVDPFFGLLATTQQRNLHAHRAPSAFVASYPFRSPQTCSSSRFDVRDSGLRSRAGGASPFLPHCRRCSVQLWPRCPQNAVITNTSTTSIPAQQTQPASPCASVRYNTTNRAPKSRLLGWELDISSTAATESGICC